MGLKTWFGKRYVASGRIGLKDELETIDVGRD